ncbi:MAG: nucleotidyltransferase, partial [Pseudomonadota bacterium]
MTGDEYILSILKKYTVPRGPESAAEQTASRIAPKIQRWAGDWLASLSYSGSYAKQTAVHGGTDVDLFISLKPEMPGTLKKIHDELFTLAALHGWNPRRRDVSIGISINGLNLDLIPGRIQAGDESYHDLYWFKSDSRRQTNVNLHVDTVAKSHRLGEIQAIKRWRHIHQLDWPSLYLELFVMNALTGRGTDSLAHNLLHALDSIGETLETTCIVDP